MLIYLFTNFSKRENSTKRPALADGDSYNCRLKTPTSVINPVIEIDQNDQQTFKNYSYAFIPDFYRFYMVNDIISDGRIWTYSLDTDVLATYRAQIGAANLYMLRSSADYNPYIVDNYYPATAEHRTVYKYINTPWLQQQNDNISIDDGTFILGIAAKPYPNGAGSYGSIQYYAVRRSNMVNLIEALMDNTITQANGFNTDDAALSLQKSLIDPLNYIKSCIWLPILYGTIDGVELTSLHVWDWEVSNVSCKLITVDPPYIGYNTSLQIDPHPQAARGKYLNMAPFTQLTLQYPPFGLINLDTSLLIDSATVNCRCLVDLITGAATLDIMAPSASGQSTNLQRLKSQIGVDIQLTQVSYDYGLNWQTGVGIGAEAVNNWLGSLLPSGISNAVSQIGNAANAMRTRSSSIGGNGSFAELRGYAFLYHDFFLIPAEDLSHAGRPLCENRRPADNPVGTYYIVRDGDIALPDGTVGEHSAVKNYLENGFFYE